MTEGRRQVFFITGGSRGIGARLVLDAAAAGHDVAFTYRTRRDAADTVLAEVAGLGIDARCRAYQLDVRHAPQVERVVDQVLEDFETVDVVVNNAAINQNGLLFSTEDEDWHDVLQTNLTGAFYVTAKPHRDIYQGPWRRSGRLTEHQRPRESATKLHLHPFFPSGLVGERSPRCNMQQLSEPNEIVNMRTYACKRAEL